MKYRYIYKKLFNYRFLLLFIVNISFFFIVSYILESHFQTNDDVIMLLFASGRYSGIPDAHLVFINYIYGLFVAFMYTNFPNIEWYTISFAFIHIISLSIISWNIIKKKMKSLNKILFLALFYVLEVSFIFTLQFTTTATLCSLAGILLICNYKFSKRIIGLLLFVIASLIRFEAAFLVLIIICPIFITYIVNVNKIDLSKPLFILIYAAGLSLFLKHIDNQIYKINDRWNYYQEYNKLRGQINDNPNSNEIINNLPSGISSADYSLFLSFFPDSKVTDLNKVKILNQSIKNVEFERKLRNFFPVLKKNSLLLIFVIVFCIGVLFGCKDKLNRLSLFISLLLFLFTLFYITLVSIPKTRVFLSALLPLLYMICNCFDNKNIRKYSLLFNLALFCLVLGLSTLTFKNWQYYVFCKRQSSEQLVLLKQYLRNRNNSIVPFYTSLNFEYCSPYLLSKVFMENQVYFSGWVTANPLNLNKFDSYLDLIDRHGIFLSRKNMNYFLFLIKESIFLNYNISIKSKIVAESENYVIVKLYIVKED